MSAPAIMEHLSMPLGFDRRRPDWQERRRQYLDHTARVLVVRRIYEVVHRTLPVWRPGPGLRTVRL